MRNVVHPAAQNLRDCQRQLDMDGCEVAVSRQALDETLALADELLTALFSARSMMSTAADMYAGDVDALLFKAGKIIFARDR